jgi:hypothetical protein
MGYLLWEVVSLNSRNYISAFVDTIFHEFRQVAGYSDTSLMSQPAPFHCKILVKMFSTPLGRFMIEFFDTRIL